MQNVCVSQSTEKALEPKSKAQPVFELAARVSVSVFLLTTQLSLAFAQIGQAYVCAGAPPLLVSLVSTTPPHALCKSQSNPPSINPENHRATPQT